jgi:D-glycero-alpha-D-manno-heptose-7-phosphate kinase
MNAQSAPANKTATLREMHQLVDEAQGVLVNPAADLDDFGRLLDVTWRLKKQTGGSITTNAIDEMYMRGMAAGALGGKLLGAGNGGFLVFYVPAHNREHVRRAMGHLLEIPFQFEYKGTQILYHRA